MTPASQDDAESQAPTARRLYLAALGCAKSAMIAVR